ncbi:MAG: PaaI family thioesterase [Proteobacteria bacterium]|nr:PaaI family thioesterase [Pseudomonadota bacterium]
MSEVKLPSSPYGDFLGIQIKEAAAGSSVCHLELKDHHMNTGGRVHGGVLTSLADTAAGVAVRSIRPEGKSSSEHLLHSAANGKDTRGPRRGDSCGQAFVQNGDICLQR